MKVWSWRQAVEKAKLEPSTKLVLYTLANHMNEHGAGCYPSIETLMEGTGLSNRVVILHINKAVEAQFLIKEQHGYRGQKWRRNEYKARYPDNVELDKCPEDKEEKGDDVKSLPSQRGSDVKSLPFAEGGDFNDKKVVTQGHTNSPENSPVGKEDTSVSSKKKRKCIPITEVQVGDVEKWASENIPPSVNLAWELGKCQDYWQSTHRKPPKDGVAAFRNWLRNVVEFQARQPAGAAKNGRVTAKNNDFDKQDYYAGTEGFIIPDYTTATEGDTTS